MSNIAHRIRIAAQFRGRDGVVDVFTSQPPKIWADKDVRFELAFFDEAGLASLDNVASLTLEVYASTRDGSPFLSRTLAAAALNGALVEAEWDAGGADDAHAVFEFTEVETDLNLGSALSLEFWMRVVCVTNDTPAKTYPAGSGRITFEKDGPYDASGVVQGGNIIPGGAAYDGSGNYTLAGLTLDKVYKWSPGANDTDLTSGSQNLTAEGNFTAQATTATLTGTPSELVTAIVRADVYLNAEEADGRYLRQPVVAWSATAFALGRLVTDQGGLWYCKQATTNEAPPTLPTTNNAYWLLLVAPGADGATGAAGATGATGAAGATGATGAAGAAGADGADGENAFTTTAANFTQPAINSTVNVQVAASGFAAVGQNLYIATGGNYEVTAVPDTTHITVKNLDVAGNAAPGATISSGAKVSPSGKPATAGAGDMILNAEQTVTALKTFNDGTMAIRNAGDTKSTTLHSSAGVDDRDLYFPDKDGEVALATVASALSYAATTTLDFGGDVWKVLALTGNVIFATANKAAGRALEVKISTTAQRTLTFPADWTWVGDITPATIPANAVWLLKLRCYGALETDVVAEMVTDFSVAVSNQTVSVSAAGDTAINYLPGGIHALKITVVDTYGAGGIWTRNFTFATAGALEGTRVRGLIILPASNEPSLNFVDSESNVLLLFTSLMFVSQMEVDFVFRDGGWEAETPRWTLADGSPAQNSYVCGTTTYEATQVIDMDGPAYQKITLTGNPTISTKASSRAGTGKAKSVTLILLASGGARTPALHADIVPLGAAITAIGSGKKAALNLTSTGSAETDTLATFVAQP